METRSMNQTRTIGVLTSGGDCPGLNAVLRGVVCAAHNLGWKVIGFYDGYEGLLEQNMHVELTLQTTEGIMQRGGTILGTTNRGHFVSKTGPGNKARISAEVLTKAQSVLDASRIAGLLPI